MSEDLARLQIRVDSVEAELADKRLKGLANTGGRAERATDGLTSAMARFAGPAAVAAAAVAGLNKVTQVTRQFDVLNAQLLTATGSAENASKAFEAIQDFATETPYDLQQATEGFSKLVNLGLTPSERAMRSYGDTASAMGKDMIQMVEAVADATTGEFERLKEFGIRSKKQGDEVAFTFRGVTETVKFNSQEIEEYLTRLGENNFAGAMANRMDTLDGAMSNLGDEWNKLWLNISQQGVGDAIEDSTRAAIAGLQELNAMVASGEMSAYFDAFTSRFDGLLADMDAGLDYLSDLWDEVPQEWKDTALEALDQIIDYMWNWPEYWRAVMKQIGVEIASLVDYAQIYGSAFIDVFVGKFDQLVATSKAYSAAVGEALNPFADDTFDLDRELARLESEYAKVSGDAWSKAAKEAEEVAQLRRDALGDIKRDRDESIKAVDDKIKKGQELRAEYEKELAARREVATDRLAGFRVGADADPNAVDPKKQAQQEKDFASLVESLRTEEEALQESYNRRLDIILANTEQGSIQQNELKNRLDEQFAEQATGGIFDVDPDTIDKQIELIEAEYQRKRDVILNNTRITEEQRTKLEEDLTKKRNKLIKGLEDKQSQMIISAGQQTFDGLTQIAKGFAGEQSGVYRAMFAASKAFAIADSVMKIQQGIANAAAMPWPANLGAIASTVTATASIVNTIQSVSLGFRKGGYTGDKGVNDVAGVVHGQEYVFDAAATRRIGKDNLERMRKGGVPKGETQVVAAQNVVNIYTDQGLSVREEKGPNNESNIYVTREEFGTMMAVEGSNPDSEFNQAQDGLYMRERA